MTPWPIGPVYEQHEELDSTNVRASELARELDVRLPMVIVAERQTAGKGRGANRWWSADGALTFSVLIDASEAALPSSLWPLASLVTALVISDVVVSAIPSGDVRVKWPNDVYLSGRKLCGILVEVPPVRPARLVIGIGINVNNSLLEAPDEVRQRATSLLDESGAPHDRDLLLTNLIDSLVVQLGRLGQGDLSFLSRWPQRCLLTGKTVLVDCASHTVQGQCEGIDTGGALLVNTSTGVERLYAGVVKAWSEQ